GRVETAAFGAAAVIDGVAPQDRRQVLQRGGVAGIDESVALRRACDVAAVEGGHGQASQRLDDQRAQALFTDILAEHPEEMADARRAAVAEPFLREACICRFGQVRVLDESGLRIEEIERT